MLTAIVEMLKRFVGGLLYIWDGEIPESNKDQKREVIKLTPVEFIQLYGLNKATCICHEFFSADPYLYYHAGTDTTYSEEYDRGLSCLEGGSNVVNLFELHNAIQIIRFEKTYNEKYLRVQTLWERKRKCKDREMNNYIRDLEKERSLLGV